MMSLADIVAVACILACFCFGVFGAGATAVSDSKLNSVHPAISIIDTASHNLI